MLIKRFEIMHCLLWFVPFSLLIHELQRVNISCRKFDGTSIKSNQVELRNSIWGSKFDGLGLKSDQVVLPKKATLLLDYFSVKSYCLAYLEKLLAWLFSYSTSIASKSILSHHDLLIKGLKWILGNGTIINFSIIIGWMIPLLLKRFYLIWWNSRMYKRHS